MKIKSVVILLVITIFLSSLAVLLEAKKVYQMGRSPFIRVNRGASAEYVIQKLIEKYPADIQKGFEMAGRGDLYEPFMEQLKQGAYQDAQIEPGEKFTWMLFRSRGRVRIVEDLEWAGNKPLDVWSFIVKKDGMNHEIIIARRCVNIALYKVEEAPPEIPEPTCDMKVTPSTPNINETVTVDMSGSQHASSMEVTVYDSEGNQLAAQALSPDNPTWETKFDKPGDYVFKAKAANERGEVSGPNCEAKIHVNFPPDCKMQTSCTECKDMVGKPITFDASGSSDPDGQLVKASFEITDDKTGDVVDTYTDNEKPFVWEKIFDKPGNYTITCTVYDDNGASAGGVEPCKISILVTQRKIFGLAEVGPMICKGTYTTFGFIRAGVLYKIKPDVVDFHVSVGGAFTTVGEPWTSFFMCNAIVTGHAEKVFFGGGLGYSSKDQETRKGGVDLVGQVGVDLFEGETIKTGSIFAEVRVPIITSDRPTDEYHKVLLGLRLTF